MADQKDIDNQSNLNREISATEKAYIEAGRRAAQLTEESRSLTTELKDQLGISTRRSEGEKTLLSLSQSITKSAQANKLALRESGDITKQLKKDNETLASAKRESLILSNSILGTDKELNEAAALYVEEIVGANTARMASLSEIDKLKQKLVGSSKEEEKGILSKILLQEEELNTAEGKLSLALENADADTQRLALGKQLVKAAQENVDEGIKQQDAQDRINKSLGVAGGLAKAFKGAFGGLAGSIGMDKVANDMEKFATEAEDAGKSVSRLQVLGVGMVSAFKGLGTTLTDPSVILTSLIKGFNAVDKAATDFQQQTGQDLNTMSTSLNQFNGGLITTAEYIKAASDLTKEFGINAAAVFTPENLSEAASMTKEMGLAGKESANLARLSKVNGGNIEMQNEKIVEGINSANRQNKTAVAHGQALRDVANVSDSIAISYAGFPDKLGEAAAAARGLGMSLGDVDKIAGSLLNFETSIANEMEAELLTGRSLNLEKARELALNNDLAGVAKELANQGITSSNFSTMNRIQQEAQAKALGMSRDEMAKMLLTQEMQNGLSADALNDAQKATLEDLKRVDAQEKFATAIAKLQQAFSPIVGIIADIASNSIVIYSVIGVALLAKMPMLVASAKGLAGGFKSALSNFSKLASGVGKMVTFGGTGRLKAAAKSIMPAGGVDKAADASKKMSNAGSGAGIKKNLQGLAAGLRSMGTGPVAKGALNLGLFGIAAIPALASLPFLLTFGTIPLGALATNFTALSTGLIAMGNTYSGIGALSLLGLAGVLMIPGSIGLAAFGLAAPYAAAGMAALVPSLLLISPLLPVLGGFTLVALGLGAAFALVGIGALAMGKGIQLAAQGFAIMVPHILSLVTSIPALFLLGGALMSIGAGLGLIAVTGLAALPALIALGAIGGIASGLFGGGGDEESAGAGGDSTSMAGVEQKLDKLISLIEAGGDVYIDGSKVGKTVALASSNMG